MLISIGQFSRMVRLSVKALRLYADSGLLLPAHVDSATGYRYYNPSQARQAEIIRILRSVDMPLVEIREVLHAGEVSGAKDHLSAHRRRLEERLRTQQRMLVHLESLISGGGRVLPYEITVTSTNPQLVAGARMHTRLTTITADVAKGFSSVFQGLAQFSCTPSGPPMLVYHDVIDEENDGDIEVCIPIQSTFVGTSGFACHELAGGTVASTVHHGPYEALSSAYHALSEWMATHGYELTGPPREISLSDPRVVSADDLQTKLEFPAEMRTNRPVSLP